MEENKMLLPNHRQLCVCGGGVAEEGVWRYMLRMGKQSQQLSAGCKMGCFPCVHLASASPVHPPPAPDASYQFLRLLNIADCGWLHMHPPSDPICVSQLHRSPPQGHSMYTGHLSSQRGA